MGLREACGEIIKKNGNDARAGVFLGITWTARISFQLWTMCQKLVHCIEISVVSNARRVDNIKTLFYLLYFTITILFCRLDKLWDYVSPRWKTLTFHSIHVEIVVLFYVQT